MNKYHERYVKEEKSVYKCYVTDDVVANIVRDLMLITIQIT